MHFCCDINTNLYVEFFMQSFNEHFTTLLDKVAPFRDRTRAICSTSPWMTDAVCSLRPKWGRTERLWKATGLEVHRTYLKHLRDSFNAVLKEARTAYSSNLISSSKRRPKILFNTINNIVSPPLSTLQCFSIDDWDKFLTFFIDKVTTRSSIHPGTCSSNSSPSRCPTVLLY